MQACKGCGNTGQDWFGDSFCDPCGGVMSRPGFLLMRHVATVDGAGGRLPIVWDESGQYYKFRHPKKINPRFEKAQKEDKEGNLVIDLEFQPTPVLTISHQSLDAVIALSQPIAKGDSEVWPELSAAPTATKAERAIMRV